MFKLNLSSHVGSPAVASNLGAPPLFLSRLAYVGLSLMLGLLALGLLLTLNRPQPALAQAFERGKLSAPNKLFIERVRETQLAEGSEPFTTTLPADAPKLTFSTKTVTPSVTAPGAIPLTYSIRLLNTGALTATSTTLRDVVPTATTFISGSLQASAGTVVYGNGIISWTGGVGFDNYVDITYSVLLSSAFTNGQVINTATISDTQIPKTITVTAVTTVTNVPIFILTKASAPAKPGPNKPLLYTLTVTNQGQPAVNLPVTVTDWVPVSTTVLTVGVDGVTNGSFVTWTRPLTLNLGESSTFTFSVLVGNVATNAVISNITYQVSSTLTALATGKLYTVTIVRPQLVLAKYILPDPPGANNEATYSITVFNLGSLATNLVITDRVPTAATYLTGGFYAGGVVSWTLPRLDTGESAVFTYSITISDVAEIPLVNRFYRVCTAESVCQAGTVVTSVIKGAEFEVMVVLDPIAKKPGGGGGPVTPTMVVRNLGPGDAINATAVMYFENISVSANDLYVTPAVGTAPPFPPGPACPITGSNCSSYVWIGSLAVGDAVTFTTYTGQSTIGGSEGNRYTATLVITDSLSNITTPPVTGTASGKITHLANLVPSKSAPAVIGRGELLTYNLEVWNSALGMDGPGFLTDRVPLSTTLVSISDGGVSQVITGGTIISWALPALSTGDRIYRNFTVRVDNHALSGSQIFNDNYGVRWTDAEASGPLSNMGLPVTTTVQDAGLVASFKTVTPTWALPGVGNVLTYVLHIANSSDISLTNVLLLDRLPWASSTYQRNAWASAGSVMSDIASLNWVGDVGPLSAQLITFTVLVDPYYEGPVTNTAVITHPSLATSVTVQAIAYITDDPVLFITKVANPDPVAYGDELEYTVSVLNAGRDATGLVITDVIPASTTYVTGSATANGQLLSGTVRWNLSVLETTSSFSFKFRVKVNTILPIVNSQYAVRSAEGASATGVPVVTQVLVRNRRYLPLVRK